MRYSSSVWGQDVCTQFVQGVLRGEVQKECSGREIWTLFGCCTDERQFLVTQGAVVFECWGCRVAGVFTAHTLAGESGRVVVSNLTLSLADAERQDSFT